MKRKYDVAAYIWPAYTPDEPRTRMFWPEGMGEWQSVKNPIRKENGSLWDRRPLWGCQNEALPSVMEMQINEALRHGVNVFIYDWYFYDNRPFLETCLNEGFLRAPNCERMQFYLMWANHDANLIWMRDLADDFGDTVVWQGTVPRPVFETVVERVVERYFSRPNYYKINGCPVFMIYDVPNLVRGLGGIEETRDALAYFRRRVRAAGFPDLHLQFTLWGEWSVDLSGFDKNRRGTSKDMFTLLGADSVSHYQFVHFLDPEADYGDILKKVGEEWARIERDYPIPYFPHITLGWDNNPRFRRFRPGIMRNNTPEMVAKGLRMAREYLDRHPEIAPLVTVNSWNEWTETSYLEPDNVNGYGYLEAVKRVFLDGE